MPPGHPREKAKEAIFALIALGVGHVSSLIGDMLTGLSGRATHATSDFLRILYGVDGDDGLHGIIGTVLAQVGHGVRGRLDRHASAAGMGGSGAGQQNAGRRGDGVVGQGAGALGAGGAAGSGGGGVGGSGGNGGLASGQGTGAAGPTGTGTGAGGSGGSGGGGGGGGGDVLPLNRRGRRRADHAAHGEATASGNAAVTGDTDSSSDRYSRLGQSSTSAECALDTCHGVFSNMLVFLMVLGNGLRMSLAAQAADDAGPTRQRTQGAGQNGPGGARHVWSCWKCTW